MAHSRRGRDLLESGGETELGILGILGIVALVAILSPAVRAARSDPMATLRAEQAHEELRTRPHPHIWPSTVMPAPFTSFGSRAAEPAD